MRRVMRGRPDSTNGTSTDPSFEPVLAPAEAPGRLTITELQTQFREHSEKWEGSETWVKLAGVLEKKLRERGSEQASSSPGSPSSLSESSSTSTSSRSEPAYGPVDAIVCIGLGSPSGFLRDGWTDRRSVSMYQLAALVSIKDMIAGEFYILAFFCYCLLLKARVLYSNHIPYLFFDGFIPIPIPLYVYLYTYQTIFTPLTYPPPTASPIQN